ncbi:MAG: hypothetical protein AB8B91_03375 [Rubripirellula sp.]
MKRTALASWFRTAAVVGATLLSIYRGSSLVSGRLTNSLDHLPESLAITRMVYDEEAVAWLTVGGDGQPGIARWDDNADGLVDNANELGAVHSDDLLVVTETNAEDDGMTKRKMFTGGYVSVRPSTAETRTTTTVGTPDRSRLKFLDGTGEPRHWLTIIEKWAHVHH